ncbi:hypothetical protein, partial [Streptomyces sp. WAC02707]|uniref:hypothetical protein n=1 Tax=Streptomyces sp. WAC02707 TaxID=2487417 RepID=UPI001C8DEA6A
WQACELRVKGVLGVTPDPLTSPLTKLAESRRSDAGKEAPTWLVKGARLELVKGRPLDSAEPRQMPMEAVAERVGTQRGVGVTDGRKTIAIGLLRWRPS